MTSLTGLVSSAGVGLLFGVDHAAYVARISAAEAFQDPAAMAASILHAQALYGHDLVIVHSDALLGIEALGGRLSFSTHGPPTLISRPQPAPRRPVDPWHDGRTPVLLEAACEVRHHLLGAAFVAVSVTGPFTLAAGVAGEASFLENLQDPGARERDILECAVQSSTRLVHAAREEGLGIMIAEPLAALISCSLFLEVLTPGLSRILAEGGEIVHICGDSSHLLPLLPSLGAPAFSLDRVDLAAASQAFGDGPMVVGGLTATAVRDGPPKRVYSATAHVCGTVERRFIPCTGCDLVWDTPAANVLAFVEGARVALGRRTMRDGRLSGLRAVSPGTV